MSDRSRSFMWNSRSNEGQGQGHYFCDLTCDLNSSRRDLYGDILLFAVAPLMRSQIEVKVWPWNGCYYITGVVNSDCLVWNCGAGRDVSNGVSQARLSEGSTQISTFYSRVAFFVRHAVRHLVRRCFIAFIMHVLEIRTYLIEASALAPLLSTLNRTIYKVSHIKRT